jgi:hypothetical protein
VKAKISHLLKWGVFIQHLNFLKELIEVTAILSSHNLLFACTKDDLHIKWLVHHSAPIPFSILRSERQRIREELELNTPFDLKKANEFYALLQLDKLSWQAKEAFLFLDLYKHLKAFDIESRCTDAKY